MITDYAARGKGRFRKTKNLPAPAHDLDLKEAFENNAHVVCREKVVPVVKNFPGKKCVISR